MMTILLLLMHSLVSSSSTSFHRPCSNSLSSVIDDALNQMRCPTVDQSRRSMIGKEIDRHTEKTNEEAASLKAKLDEKKDQQDRR